MSRLILEIELLGNSHVEYRMFDQGPISIGRGYDNDVILGDPFVSQKHVVLEMKENGLMCTDVGTMNGTYLGVKGDLDQKKKIESTVMIESGDALLLGKTVIRVLNPNHPVLPTTPLEQNPVKAPARRGMLVSLATAIVSFYIVFYIELFNSYGRKDVSVFLLLMQTTCVLLMFMFWAGLWALVTRFAKRRHLFVPHLIFTCQWVVVITGVYALVDYVNFFVCDSSFASVVSCIFGSMTLFSILNVHLSIATNMPVLRRRIVAGSIAAGLVLLPIGLVLAARNDFNPNPKHYINLKYVPKKFIRATSIDNEIKKLNSIFK